MCRTHCSSNVLRSSAVPPPSPPYTYSFGKDLTCATILRWPSAYSATPSVQAVQVSAYVKLDADRLADQSRRDGDLPLW